MWPDILPFHTGYHVQGNKLFLCVELIELIDIPKNFLPGINLIFLQENFVGLIPLRYNP